MSRQAKELPMSIQLMAQALEAQSVEGVCAAVAHGLTQRQLFMKEKINGLDFRKLVSMPVEALDALLPILRPATSRSLGWKDLVGEVLAAGRVDWMERLLDSKKLSLSIIFPLSYAEEKPGPSLLVQALEKGQGVMALLLIKRGADVDHCTDYGSSALGEITRLSCDEACAVLDELIPRLRPPVQRFDPRLNEALQRAAAHGQVPVLEKLVQLGANPHSGSRRELAFEAAARLGQIKALEFFLERGVSEAMLAKAQHAAQASREGHRSLSFIANWHAQKQLSQLEEKVDNAPPRQRRM